MAARSGALFAAPDSFNADLVRIRRHIHQHPELGFREVSTASLVAEELEKLGLDVRTAIGETGVVTDIRGTQPGPTLLLRADMDALPIEEESSEPYRSANPGVMHACGHDGHVAMLLGAARLLAEQREALSGRVRLLFQPAEEQPPGGALAMLKAGALEGVDMAVALHLWNPLPVGTIAVKPGVVMSSHDRLRIRLRGHGGHGSIPETARDPVVAMASLILSLQTVVSRSTSPLDSAVVTIGTAKAGTAFNVIPDTASLEGSIRSLDSEVRTTIHERIRSIAAGIGEAHGVQADVDIDPFVPAVVNDESISTTVAAIAKGIVGAENVRTDFQTMASDDMAFIHERVPGCYVFVGSGYTDREVFPHHHPRFDIDEGALPIGAQVLALATVAILGSSAPDRKERA